MKIAHTALSYEYVKLFILFLRMHNLQCTETKYTLIDLKSSSEHERALFHDVWVPGAIFSISFLFYFSNKASTPFISWYVQRSSIHTAPANIIQCFVVGIINGICVESDRAALIACHSHIWKQCTNGKMFYNEVYL